MNMIGYRLNQSCLRRKFIVAISASVIFSFSGAFAQYSAYALDQQQSIKNFILLAILICGPFVEVASAILLIIYFYFLLSIRIRFRLLNVALRNALGTRLHRASSAEIIRLLQTLSQQHINLTDGIKIINHCYSNQAIFVSFEPLIHLTNKYSTNYTQILSLMGCVFLNCVFQLFQTYRKLSGDDGETPHSYIFHVLKAIYAISYILMIIYFSDSTCNEVIVIDTRNWNRKC